MATEINDTTTVMSTDIYKIADFVESIKAKYMDIPEDTLVLGVYGFISSMFNNLIENTATMSAEYAYEAIPTKAKFERNIIAHALSLGINRIYATPAELDVIMCLPEQIIIDNMTNNSFTLDKDIIYNIGEDQLYPYMIDYDIILRRDKLTNGKYVYSARYDITGKNEVSDLISPYLPTIEVMSLEGEACIVLKTTLRQLSHNEIYKKILVNNPLENRVLTFQFENQLSFFYVEVEEDGIIHYLKPIYDGLYNNDIDTEYINYSFLDNNNIRLIFNEDSYLPRVNVDVTIHIYTTLGSVCNFSLNEYSSVQRLTSSRFTYNYSPWVLIQNIGDSQYGIDRLSVTEIKNLIPKEALSLGTVTTYTDLNNTFNSIQSESCRLYFLEKINNQLSRLFYAYLVLKDGDNIIPTNTINATLSKGVVSSSSTYAYTIAPGAVYYTDPLSGETNGISRDLSDEDVNEYDKLSFLYMCPYMMVINKSPLYISYYLTLLNYSKYLYFEYVNDESSIQFITINYTFQRTLYTDPDTYRIEVQATQNVDTSYQLVQYDSNGELSECNIKAYLVFYTLNTDGEEIPTRYCEAELINFEESTMAYQFMFSFKTNDQITDTQNRINIISGLKTIGTTSEAPYSMLSNMRAKVFYLVKLSTRPSNGRIYGENGQLNFDDIVPSLTDYTLVNVYSTGSDGMDIFHDYSDINYSYIELDHNKDTNSIDFKIHKIPVVRYTYMNSLILDVYDREKRVQSFLSTVDRRRKYIENMLVLLENSFGIDYKFFNTYGPSLLYNIDSASNLDRINLSLVFEIKFQNASEKSYLPLITKSIKQYIEDINYITDLHMPNLITYITNTYREQLVYIKFLKLNDYGSLHQSIYKNPDIDSDYFLDTQTVPEFININTLSNDLPDITYKIVE